VNRTRRGEPVVRTDDSGTRNGLPILGFESVSGWEDWLAEHHPDVNGAWLKFARKGSGQNSLTYAEAVEVALCYGWIDGQAASYDDAYWLQRYSPRRARSMWSKINRARVEALVEQGRMRPAGLREVERAKADGRWEAAYDPPSTATVPDDLTAALAGNPPAREFFEGLNSQNRYAILHRIQGAKKPETRARRIAKFVEMLGRGEKLHP
jgi:uncharacterized protein YdeI (YjbR/CyaY-like superfamily)